MARSTQPTPEGAVRPTRIAVRRAVLPWRSRVAPAVARAWDWVPTFPSPSGDDPISAVIGIVVFVVALPFTLPALLLTPFYLVELVVQLLLTPIVWPLRAAGAWPIELRVTKGGQLVYRESVRGLAAARERSCRLERDAAAGRFF